MSAAGDTHSAELAAGASASAAAVSQVSDAWGARWEPDEAATGAAPVGGRLVMPRVAGVHRGVLEGRLDLLAQGAEQTRAVFQVEEARDRVHFAAVTILVIAGLGGLLTVIWPIWPELLPIAPFGAILALGGWLLVVSRLQNAGPDEFFRQVQEALGSQAAEEASGGEG